MVQDWTSQLPDPMGKTRSQLCETDYRMSKCPQERTAILKSSDLIPKGEIAYSEWRQRLHQSSSEPSTPVPRAPRTHRSRRQKPWIPSSRPRIRIRCDAIAVDQSAAARISRTRALNPRLQNPTARKRGGRQAESAIVKQRIHPRHGEFEIRDPPVLNPFSTDRSISYNREKITSNSEKKIDRHRLTPSTATTDRNHGTQTRTRPRSRGRGEGGQTCTLSRILLLDSSRLGDNGAPGEKKQSRVRIGGGGIQTKRNETRRGLGRGFENLPPPPLLASSPHEQNGRVFFFFWRAVHLSDGRGERGEGGVTRGTDVEAGQRGQRPRGPRVGGRGEPRAVPWLSWTPSVSTL